MPGCSTTQKAEVRSIVRYACAPLAMLTILCACASIASADTIVLKNGRRIAALTVVEDRDKVRYQTSAGELSLPKSMVDHIEKGMASPLPDSLNAAAAANLKISPPGVSANAAIERG